jgi:hypothetical protein
MGIDPSDSIAMEASLDSIGLKSEMDPKKTAYNNILPAQPAFVAVPTSMRVLGEVIKPHPNSELSEYSTDPYNERFFGFFAKGQTFWRLQQNMKQVDPVDYFLKNAEPEVQALFEQITREPLEGSDHVDLFARKE